MVWARNRTRSSVGFQKIKFAPTKTFDWEVREVSQQLKVLSHTIKVCRCNIASKTTFLESQLLVKPNNSWGTSAGETRELVKGKKCLMCMAMPRLVPAIQARTTMVSKHSPHTHHLPALPQVPLPLHFQVVLACPKGQVHIILPLHHRMLSLHQVTMEVMRPLPVHLRVVIVEGMHLLLVLLHQVVIVAPHLEVILSKAVIPSKAVILKVVILPLEITFHQGVVTINTVEAEVVGKLVPDKTFVPGVSLFFVVVQTLLY